MAPKRGNKGIKKERNDGRSVDLTTLSFLAWFVSFVKQIAEHSSSPPDLNRFESYCAISATSFRYIGSLVVEHMSKSPEYKIDDETLMPFYTEVAIAIRWLKSGDSLNSIGQKFNVHSFTISKITNSFMEALAENCLRHLQGRWPATEEEMDPGTLARLTEECKVLSTRALKPDKRPSTILACCILHNIVHDGNVYV